MRINRCCRQSFASGTWFWLRARVVRQSMPPMPCNKRVALVTGSTSGIGAAIARRLNHSGFSVALHSRSSNEAGMRLVREFEDASYTKADLADKSSIPALIQAVLDHHGRIDVLVNNAGIVEVIPHCDLKRA